MACERGDWMLWLIGKSYPSGPWSEARKPLALAAADCAKLALPYAGRGRDVAAACIEAVRGWARGEVSQEEVLAKRRAAYAAAYAAYAAAYAADAADAADAAYAYAAAAAADAAYAYAADAADADRKKVQRECADIVRKHFPTPPVLD